MSLVVLISGKQGAGKTTTSDLVTSRLKESGVDVVRFRFSQPIYEMHNAMYEIGKAYGITLEGAKDGRLLQLIGTEWGRVTKGKDVWVKVAQKYVEDKTVPGIKQVFLFDDLRFENEFFAFPDGMRIRLEAPEAVRKLRAACWREETTHPSEVELDGYVAIGKFDVVFDTEREPLDRVAAAVFHMTMEKLG